MVIEKTKEYLVSAVGGRPLASFQTALDRDEIHERRARRKVPTRLFKIETTREELR